MDGTQISRFLKQLAIGALDSLLEGEWYSPRIDATGRMHPSLAEEFGLYESPFAQPVTSEDEFARDLGPAAAVLVGVVTRSPASAARAGATVFKTAHYATRLERAGVNVARAESEVAKAVGAIRPNMAESALVSGRMTVDGVLVEYRAMLLPNGTVNVGTIFPVVP